MRPKRGQVVRRNRMRDKSSRGTRFQNTIKAEKIRALETGRDTMTTAPGRTYINVPCKKRPLYMLPEIMIDEMSFIIIKRL